MTQNEMPKTLPNTATQAAEAAVRDAGTLRVGGLSPIFRPQSIADAGKLRIGGLSPAFGGR